MTDRILRRNISIELNPVALRARLRIFDFLKEEYENNNALIKKIPFKNKESSYKFYHDNYKLINKLEKKSFSELYKDEKNCSEKVHEIYSKIGTYYNKNNKISRNLSLIHLPKIKKLNSSLMSKKLEKKEKKISDNNNSNKTVCYKKKKKDKKIKYSMDDSKNIKQAKIKEIFGKDINNNFKITPNGGILFTNSIWRIKNINNLVKYKKGVFLRPQEKK